MVYYYRVLAQQNSIIRRGLVEVNYLEVSLGDVELQQIRSVLTQENSRICRTIQKRCEIILLLNGKSHGLATVNQVAEAAGTCANTVYNTVRLYREKGIAAVLQIKRHPRQNTSRCKEDSRVESVLNQLVSAPPPLRRKRWSGPLLSSAMHDLGIELSPSTIRRALKKQGIALGSSSDK